MPDRRRHFRSQVHESAELILRRGGDPHACTVIDASANGIQVDLDEAVDFPEELTIRFSNEASLLVRRCWSSGTKAGLEFIGNTSEPRRRTMPPLLVAEAKQSVAAGHVGLPSATQSHQEQMVQMLYPAEVTHALHVYQCQLNSEDSLRTEPEATPALAAPPEETQTPEETLDFFGLAWHKFISLN